MVLGILSVMVIMAVAFAISMRTERVAAGNYADSVRARQLVQVGLARALNTLVAPGQYGLGTNGLSSSDAKVCPDWLAMVFNPITHAYTNTSKKVYLVFPTNDSPPANEATNFVPRALWAAATNVDEDGASNHWVLIDSVITNGVVVESNRIGRVKYLILNCSSLLDANFVGGATRSMGTNPSELVIGDMPEFKVGAAGAPAFLNRRDGGASPNYRYETLEELAALCAGDFNGYPSNLTVYSCAPPGYWAVNWSCAATQVNLALAGIDLTLPANVARKNAIITGFADAGFTLAEAGVLLTNLIDYIDIDYIPGDFTNSVEAVPMINEVVVSNNVVVAVGSNPALKKYTVNTTIFVECWYPFAVDASVLFDLFYDASFSEAGGIKPDDFASSTPLGSPLAGSFIVKPLTFLQKVYDNNVQVDPISLISTIKLNVQYGAAIVDQAADIVLTNANNGASDGIYSPIASAQCLDPRFNASIDQWQKAAAVHTLYGTNTLTGGYVSIASNDFGAAMFVANGALRSAGELGYLVYSPSAPWKTVKLYGSGCHRVLDVFAIGTNASYTYVTNTIWRGRVNPNTANNIDALAAVFNNMPVDNSTNDASPHALSWSEATNVAYYIRANAQTYGSYTNLSDIGHRLSPAQFPASADNELKREAIFRNACGLLSVRQNLFTIIIEAHVASGGNIPRNPVRQRAVALVWRDPYTGEMFVRSIKWLKD